MASAASRRVALEQELAAARAERDDAQEALRAILAGEVDTVVVPGPTGRQLFSRQGAERPYRVLVETMSEGAVILIDGIIVYCNVRFAQMAGVALDEIIGSPYARFAAPRERSVLDALVANTMTSPCQARLTIRGPDGTEIPVQVGGTSIDLEGRNATCLVVSDISELLKAEETKRLGAYHRSLIEASPDPLLVLDVLGHVTDVNRATEEVTGLPRPELIGREAPIPEGITHGSAFDIRHRDGHTTAVLYSAADYFDDGGNVAGVLIGLHDITERKRAEAEIHRSEELVRLLLNSTAEGIYGVGLDGRCTFANAACLRMLGYGDIASFVGTNVQKLIHHTRANGLPNRWTECPVEETLRTGTSVHHEQEPLWRSDGTSLSAEYWSYPLRKNGDIVGAVATFIDITERGRAEAAMRLQSAALNAAANAIVISDHAGTIVWTNQAFTALSGYTSEECLGKNPRDLVKSGVHDRAFYKTLWDTIGTGQVWNGEITNRRKDGTTYAEDMTITPVRNIGGEVTHFIAVKHDLTARKHLEAQLLQSQKMETVGRLAGGIAHDFNNLLTIINGTADLVSTELREADPLRADVLEIRAAGERAAGLTRQLLAFSRTQVMTLEAVSLPALVGNMEEMLRRLIGETITLVVTPTASPVSIKADVGQIEQVILNLVVNARDAMPQGGVLTIAVGDHVPGEGEGATFGSIQAGPCACLTVSDTGTGMDAATLKRIFEPFFTTKALGKGSGLGLATVYGIVVQSGGALAVDTAPGRGTTFRIYLPRVAEAARREPAAPEMSPATPVIETVLVVEDEEGVRRMAQRMLEKAGYRVLTAANGADALLLFHTDKTPIHLMLTDVIMPGMNGPALAAQVLALRPRMKVLYTSGYTDDATLRQDVLETANFIGKPYSKEHLARRVRESLDAQPTVAQKAGAPAA